MRSTSRRTGSVDTTYPAGAAHSRGLCIRGFFQSWGCLPVVHRDPSWRKRRIPRTIASAFGTPKMARSDWRTSARPTGRNRASAALVACLPGGAGCLLGLAGQPLQNERSRDGQPPRLAVLRLLEQHWCRRARDRFGACKLAHVNDRPCSLTSPACALRRGGGPIREWPETALSWRAIREGGDGVPSSRRQGSQIGVGAD